MRVDWATHKAAKHAVENWHYSRVLPVPPLVKIGVWEAEKFAGVVLFSRGANNNLLKPFGLKQTEGCELTRVALRDHKTPVSRIIRIALNFLRESNAGMQLVVSFADYFRGPSWRDLPSWELDLHRTATSDNRIFSARRETVARSNGIKRRKN